VRLTVFFDDPFWVGVFEEERGAVLFVARHVFGAEPRDLDVLEVVRERMPVLAAVDTAAGPEAPRPANPKRLARESAKAVKDRGISTRSQDALKALQEAAKTESAASRREQRQDARERRRAAAGEKAKKKHRGH
jgi:hypothetical protein